MTVKPMLAASNGVSATEAIIGGWVVEPKYDGYRSIAVGGNGRADLYSRAGNSQKGLVPRVEAALAALPHDVVLDGEVGWVDRFAEFEGQSVPVLSFAGTCEVMKASPDLAQRRDPDGAMRLVVFDILSMDGRDLTGLADRDRRTILAGVVDVLVALGHDAVVLTPRWERWTTDFQSRLVEVGLEGTIVKNPTARYRTDSRPTNTWVKFKAATTEDVVVMGFEPGKGKFLGLIGAIEFGQFCDGKLVRRGSCSGMTDKERVKFTQSQDALVGQVMEVRSFGMSGRDRKGFRHPQFIRFRDDKKPQECAWTE